MSKKTNKKMHKHHLDTTGGKGSFVSRAWESTKNGTSSAYNWTKRQLTSQRAQNMLEAGLAGAIVFGAEEAGRKAYDGGSAKESASAGAKGAAVGAVTGAIAGAFE